jgi:hypothetical protein
MKLIPTLLCSCLLSATALAATPTPASVEKLLAASGAEKLIGSMQQQIDGYLKQAMAQATAGQTLPPEAQAFADRFREKMVANIQEEISWEKMKDLYIQIYSESFDQEEIDGLTTFYESPVGQSFTAKMPLVMQKTMGLMQQRMGPMMQKMQQSLHEAMAEVEAMKKSAEDAKAAADAPAATTESAPAPAPAK